MNKSSSIQLLVAGAAASAVGSHDLYATTSLANNSGEVPSGETQRSGSFSFAYEYVLGTSMDLVVEAEHAREAQAVENSVLDEIARLNSILNIRDSSSEIARVARGEAVQSEELQELLDTYAFWKARTDGIIDLNLAEVIQLWKEAEQTGRIPKDAALARAIAKPYAWNVDALGKAFIIDRAVQAARKLAPSGMLTIGGDLRTWGPRAWMVGVSDPAAPHDNSSLLAHFPLQDGAVATSAGYFRKFRVGNAEFSHLIDPRTLAPIGIHHSVTVAAQDSVTANALAIAASILGSDAGDRLAKEFNASGPLFLVAAQESRVTNAAPVQATASSNWPSGFEMTVNVVLKGQAGSMAGPGGRGGPSGRGGPLSGPGGRGGPMGGPMKRPYIAVWVEDSKGKIVKTLAQWGTDQKYRPELSYWWKAAAGKSASTSGISQATRPPGNYSFAWDGLDSSKSKVPKGTYKINVEVNREHGGHIFQTAVVVCGDEPGSAELRASAETEASVINYSLKAAGEAQGSSPTQAGQTHLNAQ